MSLFKNVSQTVSRVISGTPFHNSTVAWKEAITHYLIHYCELEKVDEPGKQSTDCNHYMCIGSVTITCVLVVIKLLTVTLMS